MGWFRAFNYLLSNHLTEYKFKRRSLREEVLAVNRRQEIQRLKERDTEIKDTNTLRIL